MSDDKRTAHLKAHQWKPGQTGNAGGRPRNYERRLCDVVEAMTADDPVIDPEIALDPDTKKLRRIPAYEAIVKRAVLDAVAGDRYARDFIADRLMGKAKVNVDIKSAPQRKKANLSAMSVEEKRSLLTAYETMQKLTGTDADEGDDAPTEH